MTLTEQQKTAAELQDCVPRTRFIDHAGNMNILENELDRIMQIIDSGLSGLSPRIGTARELGDDERKLCQFGLEVAHFVLNRANSLLVGHTTDSGNGGEQKG